MKRSKKTTVFFASVSLILTLLTLNLAPASSAGIPDEEWQKSGPPTSSPSWGFLSRAITETSVEFAHPYLMSFTADKYEVGTGKVLKVKKCNSMPTTECPLTEFQRYSTPLGMCAGDEGDCIESVTAKNFEGKNLSVRFLRNFAEKTGWEFEGDRKLNLPKSGQQFLVDIPDAPHAGGTQYLISSVLTGTKMPDWSTFNTVNMETAIWPVKITYGNYQISEQSLNPANYSALGIGTSNGSQCSGVGNTYTQCAIPVAAPLDVEFSLNLRFSTKISGWLHGRLREVSGEISKNSDGMQLLHVSAKFVKVPTIFGWVEKSVAPTNLTEFYGTFDPFWLNMGNGYGCPTSDCTPTSWLRNPSYSDKGMKEFALWLPIVNNKAVAAPTTWYMRTTDNDSTAKCSAITSEKLVGIVSTNATAYLPGPPSFNAADEILDYKVLAPHYLADGSEFLGTYDLMIDADYARCLYGFSSAPIKASISVVTESGTVQIATESIFERNNFMYLGAYGFKFSSPTIRVKLTQEKPKEVEMPKVELKAEEKIAVVMLPVKVNKTKIITCTKGNSVKKFSGTNPKCPSGYRKKI